MSEHVAELNGEHREKLVPVVGSIVGIYVVIVSMAYFVGNMIHQIP